MTDAITLQPFEPEHFADVIRLGNHVHGDNYLTMDTLPKIHQMGFKDGINASFVAYQGDTLVGFRLTYAPQQWSIDQWCSPEQWGHEPDKVCYFKCNTVAEGLRGQGLGGKLLRASIVEAQKQGATAGLSHIWMQSPGNSAYLYMTRMGANMIAKHPERWLQSCIDEGYVCVICGDRCSCEAAEMLLEF